MPRRVVVLGASGMLGSMVVNHLARDPAYSISATVRTEALVSEGAARLPAVAWSTLDGDGPDLPNQLQVIEEGDWVINAIGMMKSLIHDDVDAEVQRAVRINVLLPQSIAERARTVGARILQVATDCVYSGARGGYDESEVHDPLDVYGKTKSLGEVNADNVYHLRCSFIGPETPDHHRSLLDWFLSQPERATVSGYVNHRWNGVTSLHFAMLCHSIISTDARDLPHKLHVVPNGDITKCDLLSCFSRAYDRGDVSIEPTEAEVAIDRTLSSKHVELNRDLWRWAGYAQAPSIAQMVDELAEYESISAR